MSLALNLQTSTQSSVESVNQLKHLELIYNSRVVKEIDLLRIERKTVNLKIQHLRYSS